MLRGLGRILSVLWAGPNTILGCLVGTLALLSGGKIQIRCGCLEFYGGVVAWGLSRLPHGPMAALTLGHVILGRDPESLQSVRDHELVHVRQYERWGPMFLPAYLACSLYLFLRGRNPYRENPFEIEAYRRAP